MLLTFAADEIRVQIAQAVRPTLNLVKKGDAIYLVADGAPAKAKVAYATGFDPSRPKERVTTPEPAGEADDVAKTDFTESITADSFAKPLASGAPQVRIVVRSTYINVLGGQPERAIPAGVRTRQSGMRG